MLFKNLHTDLVKFKEDFFQKSDNFSPESIAWGPLGAFVVLLIALFLTTFLSAVAVFVFGNGNFEDPEVFESIPLFWLLTISAASFALPSIGLARVMSGSFREAFYNLGFRKVGIGNLFGTAILLLLVIFGLEMIMSFLTEGEIEQDVGEMIESQASLAVFLGVCVLVPIAEEIFFRGVVFAGIRKKLNFWPAALISGIIFALGHIEGGAENSISIMITILISAIALAWAYEKTNSLWTPIIIHSAMNASAFIVLSG